MVPGCCRAGQSEPRRLPERWDLRVLARLSDLEVRETGRRKIWCLGILTSRQGFFSRLLERAMNAKFRKLEGLLIGSGEGCVKDRLEGRREMLGG